MTSKTRMLEYVKTADAKAVGAALVESPELIDYRDDKGRGWLHLCCSVDPAARDLRPTQVVKTAKVLIDAGMDIDEVAFTEGPNWGATPLWFAVSRGRNLALAKHLLKLGCNPNHCLFAAGYNSDLPAIKLLVRHGAEIDPIVHDETPFLSAVKWSRFDSAMLLLRLGADVDYRDPKGRTALHCMLDKQAGIEEFRRLMKFDPRGDIADAKGRTAAAIMSRKRDPKFKRLAERWA